MEALGMRTSPRGNAAGKPPRILYVRTSWKDKAAIGANLRCLNVLRALQQVGTVEVAVLQGQGEAGDRMLELAEQFKIAHTFDVRDHGERNSIEKLRWTFDPKLDYPHGRGVDSDGMRRILRSLDEFDLIWFFKLHSADLFPNAPWPRSVVDIDDVQSRFEVAQLRTGAPAVRLAALRRLFSWKRRERLLGKRFAVLAVCSEPDKRYLHRIGVTNPIHIIPNGFDTPLAVPVRKPADPPRLGFIGVFKYPPNAEGIEWFLRRCWPRIRASVPGACLRLIGDRGNGAPKESRPGVDWLGPLADVTDEISTWSAMVVPIRLGAGMCVKVAHGFSQKCPIISTSFGARGYGVVDGWHLYIADTAEAFSDACIRTIREPKQAAEMAERAWLEFLQKWTWDAICPRVWAAAEECLRLTAESASRVSETRAPVAGRTTDPARCDDALDARQGIA